MIQAIRPPLAVLPATAADSCAAGELARQLGIRSMPAGTEALSCPDDLLVLKVAGDTLSLVRTFRGAPGPVRVDFGNSAMRHRRRAGHNELLGRAVGVGKKPQLGVLDATAGLGTDSYVLADLGAQVTLCEREPLIAALLRWGMNAAAGSGDPWLNETVARMTLYPLDARTLPPAALVPLQVIYLDPMFPERGKSAAVKKEMALFQLLLDGDSQQQDAEDLLLWALRQDMDRVVVKRPPWAEPLAAITPSHHVSGKTVRYDVYVVSKQSV